MAYRQKSTSRKIKTEDFFSVLVNKGVLIESGLSKDLIPYRIIEYQGKKFKIELKEK
jgi:hypothetical protein